MNPLDRNQIVRQVQGQAAGVIIALIAYPNRSHGETQLAEITGKDRKQIRKALRKLEVLGLVQRHGRYNGWAPTAFCAQLLLPIPAAKGAARPIEGVNIPLPEPCSGGPPRKPDTSPYLTTTTTSEGSQHPFEGVSLPLPASWIPVHDALTHQCATAPDAATNAIRAAIRRGSGPADTLTLALTWLAYCLSDYGQGINNPGAYVAAQIRRGIDAPDWFEPAIDGPNAAEIRRERYLRWNTEPG